METILRTITPSDLEPIRGLQRSYKQNHPAAELPPAEIYVGPGFAGGELVFGAFEPDGRLAGMAPLYPGPPGKFWVDILIHPTLDLEQAGELRGRLLERLERRAQELAGDQPATLAFQYLPDECENIAFVQSFDYTHTASAFRMRRDLAQPIPTPPVPDGLRVSEWRMETEAEQRRYVEASNQVFPDNPTTLENWQYFMQSPQWSVGACIAAFEGEALAGSVAVYYDPTQDPAGERYGFTEYIFVLPEWRGKGLARALVSRALAYLQARGLAYATLEVSAKNENALGLYTGLGYTVQSETWFLEKTLRK